MGMSTAVIKKFIEEDHKDHAIMVTCDNEHKFWHNTSSNPSLIWNWDKEYFIALESNSDEVVDQNKHPMQVTQVSFDEIQFLTAYIDKVSAIEFIKNNITDEDEKEKVKNLLYKVAPSMMGPRTLRDNGEKLGRF